MSFVFDRDFDLEIEQERASRHRRPETFYSTRELEAAVDQALREGVEAGRAEGRSEAEAELSESLERRHQELMESVLNQLSALLDEAEERAETLEKQLLSFMLAVFEKVAPEFVTARAEARTIAEVRAAISMALGTARMKIRLAPAMYETAGTALEAAAATVGHKGRVEILAEPGMSKGEALVEWDNGYMEYNFNRICEQILNGLRSAAGRPGPAAEAAGEE